MFVVALMLSQTLAADAAPKSDGDTIVVTGEQPDEMKTVCKPAEEELGSIIPKKVCRTKGDWAAIKRQNERRTRDYVADKNSMSARVKKQSGP